MASHKSAEKRSRQTEKKTLRNSMIKSSTKSHVKSVLSAVEAKDKEGAKGVFHKNTASRKISRLTKKVNAALK